MTTEQNLTSTVNRIQRTALLVGLVGMAAGLAGAFMGNLDRFFQAYLVAFVFWLGLSLGSMAFLMIHFLVDTHWGLPIRRVNEAASSIIWRRSCSFLRSLTI